MVVMVGPPSLFVNGLGIGTLACHAQKTRSLPRAPALIQAIRCGVLSNMTRIVGLHAIEATIDPLREDTSDSIGLSGATIPSLLSMCISRAWTRDAIKVSGMILVKKRSRPQAHQSKLAFCNRSRVEQHSAFMRFIISRTGSSSFIRPTICPDM